MKAKPILTAVLAALLSLVALAGCASLAVNPCDTIEDRDGTGSADLALAVGLSLKGYGVSVSARLRQKP